MSGVVHLLPLYALLTWTLGDCFHLERRSCYTTWGPYCILRKEAVQPSAGLCGHSEDNFLNTCITGESRTIESVEFFKKKKNLFVGDYNYLHQQMHSYSFIKHTPRLHVST
jgi:hypothetical protein